MSEIGKDRGVGHDVMFSLRDLRIAKGLEPKQLADVLDISKSLYHSIECGLRRPSIDVVFVLSVIYQTSMDFIYHAFYRQHYIWHYPDGALEYAMRKAKSIDIQYLNTRAEPLAPPKLPVAIVWDKDAAKESSDINPKIRPYGLELSNGIAQ